MVNLLKNWCPLVLQCGSLVRQCNWSGEHPGSTIDAKNVLRLVLVLLTEIRRSATDPLVYVRTIGVALLHWQAFNSGLPGLCYGEEFGEVMLSRLGSMKDRHTWAVTRATCNICSSKSALQELAHACWLVVCRPTLKPRSDSACTRVLLPTA